MSWQSITLNQSERCSPLTLKTGVLLSLRFLFPLTLTQFNRFESKDLYEWPSLRKFYHLISFEQDRLFQNFPYQVPSWQWNHHDKLYFHFKSRLFLKFSFSKTLLLLPFLLPLKAFRWPLVVFPLILEKDLHHHLVIKTSLSAFLEVFILHPFWLLKIPLEWGIEHQILSISDQWILKMHLLWLELPA